MNVRAKAVPVLFLSLLLLLLGACGLSPVVPPSPERSVASPTSRPSGVPPVSSLPPTPAATVPPLSQEQAQVVLAQFFRLLHQAEETNDPGSLQQVCVDPYLSRELELLEANGLAGSHWEVPALDWRISALSPQEGRVQVLVNKTETRLFFPPASSVPDDELCPRQVRSYRDCRYDQVYVLEWRQDRWYVAEVQGEPGCAAVCRRPTAGLPPTTPIPGLVYPPAAVLAETPPPLPADLYFLRDGGLWRWPAAGGEMEEVSSADEIQEHSVTPGGRYVVYRTAQGLDVLDRSAGQYVLQTEEAVPSYRLAAGGRYLVYLAAQGTLHVLELDTREGQAVTPAGPVRQFDLTADGRYLLYLAELQGQSALGGEPYAADLWALDLQQPDQGAVLGHCGIRESEVYGPLGCKGFLASPDGRQVVYRDGEGFWLAQIPGRQPRLLKQVLLPEEEGGSFCVPFDPLAWLPGEQGLLVWMRCYEGGGLSVLDIQTGQLWPQEDLVWCYVDCDVRWALGETVLWVSDIPNGFQQVRYPASGQGQVEELDQVTALWPNDLQALDGGRLGLAQQRCRPPDAGEEGPGAAVYILEADGRLERVAPLPQFACRERYRNYPVVGELVRGQVLWTRDGAAFLYLGPEGQPLLLGRSDGSALWDVRELLAGASQFRWGVEE